MDDKAMPRRKGRAWKWILGVSLALNLLVIGAMGGAALRHGGFDREARSASQPPQRYGAPFVRALPREAQRDMRRTLRAQARAEGLPNRSARRASYEEMVALLRAPDFDAGAARAVFDAQSQTARQVEGKARGVWLEIVAEMSAAERQVVADRLEEALTRKRSKKPRKE